MRKLKLQVHISVDGFVATPEGGEDWIHSMPSDPKLRELISELAETSDTLLLGRNMAEKFIPHFESYEPDSPRSAFAQKMVSIPKIIFSKTLSEPFGLNTSLAGGDLDEEIARLKKQEGRDILVYGGAGFVSSLIAGGHIDEFYLLIIPVMINKGMRIFDELNHHQKLSLVSAIPYGNGVTVLRYQLNKA